MDRISEIAEKISSSEKSKRDLAGIIKDQGFSISRQVDKTPLGDLKVAGVDGGLVKRSLHGFDFILARAVGVYFEYTGGRISRVEYFPSKTPEPELFFMESASDTDYAYSSSITRQHMEIDCALKMAKKFRPELLLLDGSVVPHYSDRPGNETNVYRSYLGMIQSYENLFSFCNENGILLAGVVEDSRGRSFCSYLKNEIAPEIRNPEAAKVLDACRDTGLLYWILDHGEMTRVFSYSENPKDHPVLRDFGDFEINSFYLKSAEYDRPVRIDFLGEPSLANKVAASVFSISSHHSGYGIPSVLIEADQAAKLTEEEIGSVVEEIAARSGSFPGLFDLRRDSRPF